MSVDLALDYAARGWPVFPLKPGEKIPATQHGFKEATVDPDRVRRWWRRWPNCNIGLRTGETFDVLDIDSPEAEKALDRVLAATAAPDEYLIGPTVKTPRGWHLYVAPTGHGNTVRVGGIEGLDWRGRGGYVVAPGSARDGTRWTWELDGDPLYGPDAEIRPAPPWLLDLLVKPAPPAPTTQPMPLPQADRYARAAIERATGRLAVAAVGERNHCLNREAYGLGRLVGARLLTADEAGQPLLRVAIQIGLDETEAVATIRSGLKAGIAQPINRGTAA